MVRPQWLDVHILFSCVCVERVKRIKSFLWHTNLCPLLFYSFLSIPPLHFHSKATFNTKLKYIVLSQFVPDPLYLCGCAGLKWEQVRRENIVKWVRFEWINIHWASKETYHFFRATLTKMIKSTLSKLIFGHKLEYSLIRISEKQDFLASKRRKMRLNHER